MTGILLARFLFICSSVLVMTTARRHAVACQWQGWWRGAGMEFDWRARWCAAQVTAAGFNATVARAGESKRPVVESPWSQSASECQRFGHPLRLNN
eukprot:COSAG01_NODE_4127_length_5326_cov_3.238569_5_plen_96_part_00